MLQDAEQKDYRRWVFGYIPVFFITILISASLLSFILYFLSYTPRLAMEQWSCSGQVDNEERWNAEMKKLLIASYIDRNNADVYFDIGKMYEWKAVQADVWNTAAKESRENAIHYFKLATENRPTWAKAWVSLAQNKLLNRELDQEVYTSIQNAIDYGMWQKDLQPKLLWLSIGIWKNLPQKLQDSVKEQILRTLTRENSIGSVVSIAVRFQWLDELLNVVQDEEHKAYINRVKSRPDIQRNMLKGEQESDFVC